AQRGRAAGAEAGCIRRTARAAWGRSETTLVSQAIVIAPRSVPPASAIANGQREGEAMDAHVPSNPQVASQPPHATTRSAAPPIRTQYRFTACPAPAAASFVLDPTRRFGPRRQPAQPRRSAAPAAPRPHG